MEEDEDEEYVCGNGYDNEGNVENLDVIHGLGMLLVG